MLSYEKKIEMVEKFITDCEITDDKEEFENSPIPMYLVENLNLVTEAYLADLENLTDEIYDNSGHENIKNAVESLFEGESVEEFLDRHNIKWE